MRITPLEIRQKTFEKIFRGYDKDEVTAFLTLMSQEWEKINDEKKMLEMRYEQSQKESEKLRQVEASLFKTLKAAEDTGALIIEEANKTAETILNEVRMNAMTLKSDVEKQAKQTVQSAETQARTIMEDLREDVTALVESYETLLAQRETVLNNLKNIATETIEALNVAEEELQHIDVTAHVKIIKELNRESSFSLASDIASKDTIQPVVTEPEPEDKEVVEKLPETAERSETPEATGIQEKESPVAETPTPEPEVKRDEVQDEREKKQESGSFFDQFD